MSAASVGLYHVIILIKMVVKSHGSYPLTLVKIASSHLFTSILMRRSAKMEASHLIDILNIFLVGLFFKWGLSPRYIYSIFLTRVESHIYYVAAKITYVQIFNYKSFVTGFNLNFVTDFFNHTQWAH